MGVSWVWSEIREKPERGPRGGWRGGWQVKEPSRRRDTPTQWGGGPQGCPIQGEGRRGWSVATSHMASPGNLRRPPTQAPVTVNHTRPTLVLSISPAPCSSGHPIFSGGTGRRGQTCQQPEGRTTTRGLYVQAPGLGLLNSAKTSKGHPRRHPDQGS